MLGSALVFMALSFGVSTGVGSTEIASGFEESFVIKNGATMGDTDSGVSIGVMLFNLMSSVLSIFCNAFVNEVIMTGESSEAVCFL
jgi:hypothetical protein